LVVGLRSVTVPNLAVLDLVLGSARWRDVEVVPVFSSWLLMTTSAFVALALFRVYAALALLIFLQVRIGSNLSRHGMLTVLLFLVNFGIAPSDDLLLDDLVN